MMTPKDTPHKQPANSLLHLIFDEKSRQLQQDLAANTFGATFLFVVSSVAFPMKPFFSLDANLSTKLPIHLCSLRLQLLTFVIKRQ